MQANETPKPDFEVFPYRKGEPSITINSQGKISLNKGARFALGEPEHMLLKYDKDHRIIGLEPCGASDGRAHPVRNHDRNNAYTYARAFLEHYGLAVKKTERYEAQLVNGELRVSLENGAN